MRTVLFIVVFAAVGGTLLVVVDALQLTPGQAFWLYLAATAIAVPLMSAAALLADRWFPEFRAVPDRLIVGEVPPMLADVETQTLEGDYGHHFHLGRGAIEQPWALCPVAWKLDYAQDCLARLASLLLNEAGIAHTCDEQGNVVRVAIPRVRDSGFDITIEAATHGVIVRAGSLFHAHFPLGSEGSPQDDLDSQLYDEDDPDSQFYDEGESFDPYDTYAHAPAEQAFGLVRDLLSPGVRIRERRAAGVVYHAALEAEEDHYWRRRRSVTLYRYPYFGKRDECFRTNTHLDPRLAE